MRIKNGFELRNVCGEHIIISHGIENIDFTEILTLNESAAYIWNKVIGTDFTEEDVVRVLLEEYDVTEEEAWGDVKELLASWVTVGIAES